MPLIRRDKLPAAAIIITSVTSILVRIFVGDDGIPWGGTRIGYMIWYGSVILVILLYLCYAPIGGKFRTFRLVTSFARRIRIWVYLFAWLNIFALSIGILRQNPVSYIIGDTAKYALLPIGYIIAVCCIREVGQIDKILFLMAVLTHVLAYFQGASIGTEGLALGYVVISLAKKKSLSNYSIFIFLSLFTASLGKTTILLVFALLMIASFIIPTFKVRNLLILVSTLVLLVAMIFSFTTIGEGTTSYKKTTSMMSTLNLEDYSSLDESTYQRLQECILVYEKFSKGDYVAWMLGYGNGAVYSNEGLPKSIVLLSETLLGGYMHNIHVNPVFMFHHWGLLGWMLHGTLIILLIKCGNKIRYSKLIPVEYASALNRTFLMICIIIIHTLVNPPKDAYLYLGLLIGMLTITADSALQSNYSLSLSSEKRSLQVLRHYEPSNA